MTALAKDFDYAKNGLATLLRDVDRARIRFDAGTEQRIQAIAEIAALPASSADLRAYIADQAAANPGTQWSDIKAELDLLVAASTTMKAAMEARHAADEAAA